MRRAALPLAVLVGLVAAAPALVQEAGRRSLDPVALRLLPPLSRVPMLVARDGSLVPMAGDPAAAPAPGRPFVVAHGEVVWLRGHGVARRPLGEFRLDEQGRPETTTRLFLAGTDSFGRDLAARLLAGLRLSVLIALGAVAGAAVLAGLAGLAGGLAGRAVDGVLSLAGDGLLSIPRIVLVMALALAVEPGPAVLALVLALTGWPAMARLVRVEVRRMRDADVALAARAAGASPLRVALVHVLPEAAATLAIAAGLRIAPTILLEASLSFLGAGVSPPAASLGTILAEGRDVLLDAWWVSTLPGIALVLFVLAVSRSVDRIQFASETR
ncbi:MAG: hypothetical protein Kow0062_14180 [Acidobacteriota bacterium]